MKVLDTAAFQQAGREAGADGSNFYLAMQAAAANEAGYQISYDYYVNTAEFAGGGGNFLQGGTLRQHRQRLLRSELCARSRNSSSTVRSSPVGR